MLAPEIVFPLYFSIATVGAALSNTKSLVSISL
jgi:hypothetical protein